MNQAAKFKIDTAKTFAQLPNAPVVEAVVQWQATPTRQLEQSVLERELTEGFPTFQMQPQQEFGFQAAFSGEPTGVEVKHQLTQWQGFRLTSSDQKHICQFTRDSVIFSRLAPYEGWKEFLGAARPFWRQFLDSALPRCIDRLGVRFISRIFLKDGQQVSDFVHRAPAPLKKAGLQSGSFFHQDTIPVTGHPYQVKLIQTLQSALPPMASHDSLIVDIDVETLEATPLESVESALQEMRFIKNEVFFTVMKNAKKKFA